MFEKLEGFRVIWFHFISIFISIYGTFQTLQAVDQLLTSLTPGNFLATSFPTYF